MTPLVSVVIPAYREAGRIGETVRAVKRTLEGRDDLAFEIIVVDDGSPDATGAEAAQAGAEVVSLARNGGKGAALAAGFRAAKGDVLVMLDGDLRETAGEVVRLLDPVLQGRADMTVAVLPAAAKRGGGFGLVMGLARWGMRRAGGTPLRAPLSGQRALTRRLWERIGRFDPGFGVEMGLNLDAARAGARMLEVETRIGHRVTGKDWAGFVHRGRQFRDILRCLLHRWRAVLRLPERQASIRKPGES